MQLEHTDTADDISPKLKSLLKFVAALFVVTSTLHYNNGGVLRGLYE